MVKLEINGVSVPCSTIKGQSGPFESVRVTGRLRSTRGGRNFWWEKKNIKIDVAPFEPFIDLEFRGEVQIEWLGWHSYRPEYLRDDDGPLLTFGGSLTSAGAVITGKEVIDLSRKSERRDVLGLLGKCEVIALHRQGHLEVRQLRQNEELPKADLWRDKLGPSPVVLFNHSAYFGEQKYFGVKTLKCRYGNGMYVAISIHESGEGRLTSPDHILEPLMMGPGLWLLFHPWPGDGRD